MYLLRKNKTVICLLLLLALCFPAVVALFHPGFFLSDDGNWMVIRFSAFYEALKSQQFPVRFLPRLNFGYGYPVADFLYPLFMYIAVPIHLLGVNFVTTIKILFGASLLISGFGTFLWLKKITGTMGALTGAVIYALFPYHIFDMYQRGSIGEVLALAIVPLIFWQIERKKSLLVAIGIALLILAHNSLAILFLPIIVGYMFLRNIFSFRQIVQTMLLALGLAAFFWIPALYDKQYTVFDTTAVSSLQSYFLRSNTYYLAGWISYIVLVLIVPLLFIKQKMLLFYFLFLALFSLFLTLPFSYAVWQVSHIGPFFQFPYRFLSLTMLCIAFLGAYTVDGLPKKIHIVSVVLVIGIVYVSSWNLFFPKIFQNYPDTFYSTNQDSTTVKNEYMPKWVKVLPTKQSSEKAFITNGSGSLEILQDKGSRLLFQTTMHSAGVLIINTIDFPGWQATVDGKKVAITHANDKGVIEIQVPKGSHVVSVWFTETPVRLMADSISLAALIALIIFSLKKKHEK